MTSRRRLLGVLGSHHLGALLIMLLSASVEETGKREKKNVWDWSCFYWKISFQSNFFFQQGEFWCWSFYSTLRINVLNFKMCNKKYGSAINKNILITSPRCEGKCDWFFFPLGENWIYKINYWSNYTNFRREMIFRASSGFHENS